jgi:FAD/FMN-containing dehydrogenase
MCNLRGGRGLHRRRRRHAQALLARPLAHRGHLRHTNAFKINEDVVIPLPRMGDYCDGIERINIELSTRNKLALCDALAEFLRATCRCNQGDANLDRDVLIGDRRQARSTRAAVRERWQWLLDNLDLPLAEAERVSKPMASSPAS